MKAVIPTASTQTSAPVQKYIDDLLKWLEEGKMKLHDIITHRLPLGEAPRAYEIFSEKKDGCVKVVLKP
jgi:S-(hydroxymethyl)glutathione dehydrogenase/alcohol dehydrogenase